ncbi:hypothetical protein [Nocardioides sp.]|uniref:hypothetical protein n=1 Tax=Nocardioides sp. TaxID=35761 RepID=UPI00378454B1
MSSPARSLRAALVLLTALLTVLVGVGVAAPAQAQAVTKQRVYGSLIFPNHDAPHVKMMWFDSGWGYLGQGWANGGGYSVKLAPGTYHLQFIDQRASWDTKKYAPTDVTVRVGDRAVARNVTMRRGASITGTATGGGRPLAGARVVAANQSNQSFATTANSKGQFAVGGLPAGKYCLFTYDRKKQYVGKCTWAGGLNYAQSRNVNVALKQRAGNLTVFVDTAAGASAPSAALTVTSAVTGQWWTATVKGGKAVFTGVYPGRYRFKYDGAGVWLPATGTVRNGNVRAGAMAFGDVRLTKRGGWVTGSLVDGGPTGQGSTYALTPPYTGAHGASVSLYSASGIKLASGYSDKDGNFTLQGQMTTQTNLTLVVQPTTESGGYMMGEGYCLFKQVKFSAEPDSAAPIGVTTGQETFLGELPVPRAADQSNPKCITT